MAEIHKVTKDGVIVWPATVSDAVVHPDTRNSVTKSISTYNTTTLWPDQSFLGGGKFTFSAALQILNQNLGSSSKNVGTKLEFTDANNKIQTWVYTYGTKDFEDEAAWIRTDSNIIQELEEEVFPLVVTLAASSTIAQVGESTSITLTWTVTRRGKDVTDNANVTLNGESVSGIKTRSVTINESSHTTLSYTLSATYEGLTSAKTVEVEVVHPSYFDTVPSSFSPSSESVIKATVGEILNASKAYTKTGISLSNKCVCYCYPSYFGALTSIKDANNFEYLSSYTKTTVSVNSTTYYAYKLTDATTITGFTQIYK